MKKIFIVLILLLAFFYYVSVFKSGKFPYFKFNINETDRYELSFTQQSCNLKNICKTFNFKADVYMKIKNLQKESVWLMVKLDNIQTTDNNSALLKILKKIYKNPFLIKMDKNGEIKEFVFKGDKENYGGLMQSFDYFSIVLKDAKKYKLKQKDTLGKYLALYERKGTWVEKKILKYTVLFNTGLTDEIKISKALFKAQISNTHNWLEKVEGNADFIFYREGRFLMLSKNRVVLKFIEKTDKNVFKDIDKKPLETVKKEFSEKKLNVYEEALKAKQRQIYKNISIKEMINSLDGGLLAYSRLKDYLQVYPDKMNDVVRSFNNLSDSKQSKIIGYMRFICDMPQIQKGLIEIYNNTPSRKNRLRSLIVLGFVKNPTDKTVDFLIDKINGDNMEISYTALLALGSISKYRKDLRDIILRYYEKGNTDQKKAALKAMKNGGFSLEKITP